MQRGFYFTAVAAGELKEFLKIRSPLPQISSPKIYYRPISIAMHLIPKLLFINSYTNDQRTRR
ncbi:MAG: hypothetical protein JWR72_1709 [Flavisolibacter sp.]|jgi:hypothetical protein|nr:hypothetical protein [Flavisolibacter sp.]